MSTNSPQGNKAVIVTYKNSLQADVLIVPLHYNDVIMGTIASQITSLTIVYWTFYSDADQRKHQSSASLAFVRGNHRWPVNSPHKWPVTRKMFPFDDVIMKDIVWGFQVDDTWHRWLWINIGSGKVHVQGIPDIMLMKYVIFPQSRVMTVWIWLLP